MFSKSRVFSINNPTKLDLKILAQPRDHMGTQEKLSDNSRCTLEATFQVMIVVMIYREGQRQLEKDVLHPKSTLARPPIYNQT